MIYYASGFGALPATDITIGSQSPWYFTFSSFMTKASVIQGLSDVGIDQLATGVNVTTSGFLGVTITLKPLSNYALSMWQDIFSSMGLTNMTDVQAGTPDINTASPLVQTISSPVQNVTSFYQPIIASAESSISNLWSGLKTSGMYIVVGGVSLMALYAYMKGLGSRPSYHSNPKGGRKKYGRR